MLIVVQWVGRGRDGLYCEGVFKEKIFGCQEASKENGAG